MSGRHNRSGWISGRRDGCDPAPCERERAFRVVLLGPPGVGKGTQAQLLSDALRACHLSTGELFRAAKCEARPSPAMREALAAMKRGELVSDELVVAMVRERSACLRCHGGFLLDGFPRTVGQAESLSQLLDELGVQLDAVLSYELPIEEIVSRLGGRRTCFSCRAVYHLAARPPRVAGICDACQASLIEREDDQPEAIRVRMRHYENETAPLVDYYRRQGRLLVVPATGDPAEIRDRTLIALGDHLSVGSSIAEGDVLAWREPAASGQTLRRTSA